MIKCILFDAMEGKCNTVDEMAEVIMASFGEIFHSGLTREEALRVYSIKCNGGNIYQMVEGVSEETKSLVMKLLSYLKGVIPNEIKGENRYRIFNQLVYVCLDIFWKLTVKFFGSMAVEEARKEMKARLHNMDCLVT